MSAWRAAIKGWRHSIKGRLLGLFVLLALGTAAVFLLGMQRLLHNGWQAYAQPMVADYVDRLAADIGSPPDAARARALAERLPIAVRIEGPQLQLDTHAHSTRRHWRNDADEARDWGLTRSTADGHRITFSLAAPPDTARPRIFGWATLAALLALTTGAYIAVGRMLRPLDDITAGVRAYGRGDFTQPIPLKREDELGALSTRINAMATSLGGMLDDKRALLLAMSHELRSPLTRARINTELLEDSPERTALLRDLGEMRDLITTLLESERLASGPAALQAEATDLAALVRDLVSTQFASQALTLQLETLPGPVLADPTRLRLLLRNLIDNALRHAAGATPVPEVFLRTEADGRIALGVRDHGPGVSPEHLAQLGQPFFRPDVARTRGAGGVGLGLYLCQRVAQAHGGELRLRNAAPGLEVSALWMPAELPTSAPNSVPVSSAAAAARSSPR